MDMSVDFVPQSDYDFVVIGGGPAGSTFATLMAQAGRSVLVLEGAKFPRFAVGEIIAPTGVWRTWHRLGITRDMLDARFIRKFRGAWQSPNGTVFQFEQDVHPDDPRCEAFVYSLERAVYDEFLLDHARAAGATALEEAQVQEVLYDGSGRMSGVRFSRHGHEHEVGCALVVDASGRAAFLPNLLQLRKDIVELKSFASFAHYEGARRDTGDAEGDVRILFMEDMWFWWAPLQGTKSSVGIVANRDRYWDEYSQDPEAFYEKYVRSHDFIRERLTEARRVTGFRSVATGSGGAKLSNFHAYTTELVGDGWVVVGDAVSFIDPIFSAGLFVAHQSGEDLADAALAALQNGGLSKQALKSYEERQLESFGQVMSYIQQFATNYFDPDFVDIFLYLGNRSSDVRQLYIDTFVAYDRDAIKRYAELLQRLFHGQKPKQEVV